jgi:antitoxin HicB
MLHYPVRLTTEGASVLVDFPDFPEAHTYGETREEALTRASDALLTVIDAYMKDRQRLPQPSKGKVMVNVPVLAVPKIELYNAMREKRITKAELGRRLGWHMPQVDRVLDVHHASRMDRLQQALQAVDRRLEVTVVEA